VQEPLRIKAACAQGRLGGLARTRQGCSPAPKTAIDLNLAPGRLRQMRFHIASWRFHVVDSSLPTVSTSTWLLHTKLNSDLMMVAVVVVVAVYPRIN